MNVLLSQVDFYVLSDSAPLSRLQFVCRLADKLQKLRKSVCIAVDSTTQANTLDTLLWEFPPESFLPHRVASAAQTQSQDELCILATDELNAPVDVYINLCSTPPHQALQMERLVEVVIQDPTVLEQTREHFKFYRQQGYPIQSHTIGG